MGILERNENLINYNLLSEKPLYNYSHNKTVNVLIIGNTELSINFLRSAYHCCQMSNLKINITYLTNNEFIKKDFYNSAPEIRNFDYATINFDMRLNDIKVVLREYVNYSYVYIDVESLEYSYRPIDNSEIADMCRETFEDNTQLDKICINYLLEDYYVSSAPYVVNERKEYGKTELNKISKKIKPGFKNELEQRAFNIHYAYVKMYNQRANINEEYKKFLKDDYSYDSSIAAAVNIAYKLKSIGVDEQTSKKELVNKITRHKERLIALEHQRWNAFMIINGWRCPTIEEYREYAFVNGNTHKNTTLKLHPCIVESRVYNHDEKIIPINQRSKTKIDSYTIDGISNMKIDELDKQSLRIHLDAKEKTETLSKIFVVEYVGKDYFNELAEIFSSCGNSFINFDIESYNRFVSICKDLVEEKSEIKLLLDKIAVVKEYIEFKDYKKIDEYIVDLIPYLLSRHSNNKLLKLKGSHLVRDIASTLMIEPDIVYFYKYSQEDKVRIESFFKERFSNNVPIEICFVEQLDPMVKEELILEITDAEPMDVYRICNYDFSSVICLNNARLFDAKTESFFETPIKKLSFTVKEIMLLNGIQLMSESKRAYTDLNDAWKVFSEFSRPEKGNAQKNGNFAKAVNFLNGTSEYTKLIRDGRQFVLEEKQYSKTYYEVEQIERLKTLLLNSKLISSIKPKPHNSIEAFECKNDSISYYMEKGGNFLEQYISCYAEFSNMFDDVRTNIMFKWDNDAQNLCNEIDIILVKGFETAFISCKNTEKLNQLYIHQIRSIADKIGAIPYLVHVGQDNTENNSAIALAEFMGVKILTYKNILPGAIETVLKNLFSGEINKVLKVQRNN